MGVFHLGVDVVRVVDRKQLDGLLEFYERLPDERDWRKVMEASNIILNQFYVDLFNVQGALSVVDFTIKAMALGIGNTAPTRTDVGLTREWNGLEVGVLAAGGLAAGTTTAIPLAFPVAATLAAGAVLGVGAPAGPPRSSDACASQRQSFAAGGSRGSRRRAAR